MLKLFPCKLNDLDFINQWLQLIALHAKHNPGEMIITASSGGGASVEKRNLIEIKVEIASVTSQIRTRKTPSALESKPRQN